MILKPIKLYNGMGLSSFLVTLSIFTGLLMSINQWISYQHKSAVGIYQRFQAVQIAENQKQRQFLGLDCQPLILQNNLEFKILCDTDKINIRYPQGEINL